MTEESTHYPDLPVSGLGDLKSIKRLPTMNTNPPKIRWGDTYMSWPIEKRLKHAELTASSMNHAADVLQTERNALNKRVADLEAQIKHTAHAYVAQGDTMHKELGNAGAEKQELYQQIVDQTRLIKKLKLENDRLNKQLADN